MSVKSQEVNGGHGEQRATGAGGGEFRHLTPALSPIEAEREKTQGHGIRHLTPALSPIEAEREKTRDEFRHLTPALSPIEAEREEGTEFRHLTPALSPVGAEREGGTQRTARPALRLAPVVVKAREDMSMGELSRAARDHQAALMLEAEVCRLATQCGLGLAEARKLGQASWAGFRIVNGEAIPVQADRQTVVLGLDGVNVMSVQEWVSRKAQGRRKNEEWGPGEAEVLPMRNPFRRATRNLTEQMQLERRDPRLARRLEAEARAAGED